MNTILGSHSYNIKDSQSSHYYPTTFSYNPATNTLLAEVLFKGKKYLLKPEHIQLLYAGSNFRGHPEKFLEFLVRCVQQALLPRKTIQVEVTNDRPVKLTMDARSFCGLSGGSVEIVPVSDDPFELFRTKDKHPKPSDLLPPTDTEMRLHLDDSRKTKRQHELSLESQSAKAFLDPSYGKRQVVEEKLFMDDYCWSFENYMSQALFNPKYGYYGTGKPGFNDSVEFTTHASEDKEFPKVIALHIFTCWMSMVKTGDINLDDPFAIVECGAGNGIFAKRILKALQDYAESSQDPNLKQFSKQVEYIIVEISPALADRQKETNKEFILTGQMKVIQGDARQLKILFPSPFNGFFISNELPDTFPCHRIKFCADHKLRALAVVPLLDVELFKQLPEKLKDRLYKQHQFCIKSYPTLLNQDCNIPANHMVISAKDIDRLPVEMLSAVKWKHVYLPVEHFPELETYLSEYAPHLYRSMKPGDTRYINWGIRNFMENVTQVLNRGIVITVDYGWNNAIDYANKECPYPDSSLRIYTKSTQELQDPQNPVFDGMGQCDMTVSVNFSQLAEEGMRQGLIPVSYSFQRDLRQLMRMQENQNLADEAFKMTFDCDPKSKSQEIFKFFVQKTATTQSHFHIPARLSLLLDSQFIRNDFDKDSDTENAHLKTTVEILSNVLHYLNGLTSIPGGQEIVKMYYIRGHATETFDGLLLSLLDVLKHRKDLGQNPDLFFQTLATCSKTDDPFQECVLELLKALFYKHADAQWYTANLIKECEDVRKAELEKLKDDATKSERIATEIKVLEEYLAGRYLYITNANKTFRDKLLKEIATAYLALKK